MQESKSKARRSALPELTFQLLFKLYLNERTWHAFHVNLPDDSPIECFLTSMTWYRGVEVGTKTAKMGTDKTMKMTEMEMELPRNIQLMQERLLERQKKGNKRITGREALEMLISINKELKK